MRLHHAVPLVVLLFAGLVPLVARAQFSPVSKDELSMTSDPKAPGAAAVYLYREEADDDPHAFRTVYARIKVLTEEGKSAAVVHIDFPHTFIFNALGNNSSHLASGTATSFSLPSIQRNGEDQPWDTDSYEGKVEIGALEGRVIRGDGSIVPLVGKASEILKVSKGPRGSETTFTIPGVEVGSVIEYRYQVRYDRFLTAPDWTLQTKYFIHKEHFLFHPAERFVPTIGRSTAAGVSDSLLKNSHDDVLTDIRCWPVLPEGKTLVRDAMGNFLVDLTDVPAIPQEPFAPPQNATAYSANFFYTYTPDARDYWQKQMGYWNRKLSQYISSTSDLQNAVQQTISPSDAPLEKAKKLYAFVQKIQNTDSSPDGAPRTGSEWIPAGKVDSVLQAGKGSSNQIAFLYLALVRAAGISARPERIASRSIQIFSPQYLNNIQLDTVLIALQIDGKEILVDPGTKMAPFQTLHWAHAGAGGIAPGDGNKAEIIVTPLQKITENSTLHVGTVNVSANGAVSGTLKVAFVGQKAIELRQLGAMSGDEAVKAEINSIMVQQVPPGIHTTVDHIGYLDDPDRQLAVVGHEPAWQRRIEVVIGRMGQR